MIESQKYWRAILLSSAGVLAACGGGGDGNDISTPQLVAPNINASVALADLFNRLPEFEVAIHVEGYRFGRARILVGDELGGPIVVNGKSAPPVLVKRLELQVDDGDGRLIDRVVSVLYIDPTNAHLLGAVMGRDPSARWYAYSTCFGSASSSSLPSSTNSEGIWAAGYNGDFSRTVRAGQHADFCDYQPYSEREWRWSVEAANPYPYFCLQAPVTFGLTSARLCIQTDAESKLTDKIWVRTYSSLGLTYTDYRSN